MRKGAHSSAVKIEMQAKIKDRSQKNSLILHAVMTFSFLSKESHTLSLRVLSKIP